MKRKREKKWIIADVIKVAKFEDKTMLRLHLWSNETWVVTISSKSRKVDDIKDGDVIRFMEPFDSVEICKC
jgi:hypothetical protein